MLTSAGHDEYWSSEERDVVDRFVERGGNAAFFIGNAAFWQVRLEDDGQVMVCYKYVPEFDPVHGTAREKYLTGMWSNPRTGRPENETFGLSFTRGGYHGIHRSVPRGARGYEIHRPDHWLLAGIGYRKLTVSTDAADLDYSGVEWLHLEFGGDWYPTSVIGFGPYLGFDWGIYGDHPGDGDSSSHFQVTTGLRINLDVPGK